MIYNNKNLFIHFSSWGQSCYVYIAGVGTYIQFDYLEISVGCKQTIENQK